MIPRYVNQCTSIYREAVFICRHILVESCWRGSWRKSWWKSYRSWWGNTDREGPPSPTMSSNSSWPPGNWSLITPHPPLPQKKRRKRSRKTQKQFDHVHVLGNFIFKLIDLLIILQCLIWNSYLQKSSNCRDLMTKCMYNEGGFFQVYVSKFFFVFYQM